MDFRLSETEQAVRDAVGTVLERSESHRGGGALYDNKLEGELREAGYLALLHEEGGGMLAALVVEGVAAGLGDIAVGAHAMVLAALGAGDVSGPVAIVRDGRPGPARFVAAGGHALVVGPVDVTLHAVTGSGGPVARWGQPMAEATLGPVQQQWAREAERTSAWWRVSVAVELVGLIDVALRCVSEHLTARVQFGKPIASRQAVAHRLAGIKVRLEGSRYLAYRAAWGGADPEAALSASAYATSAGRLAVRELHQLCGSIGLTYEFSLQRATTRIVALTGELGGAVTQQRALAQRRWALEQAR